MLRGTDFWIGAIYASYLVSDTNSAIPDAVLLIVAHLSKPLLLKLVVQYQIHWVKLSNAGVAKLFILARYINKVL